MKDCQPPIDLASAWLKLPTNDRYISYIDVNDNPLKQPELVKKTPVQYLRKEPCIIPLEPTIPQSDPRLSKPMSFIDLACVNVENLQNTASRKREREPECDEELPPSKKQAEIQPGTMDKAEEEELLENLEDLVQLTINDWLVVDQVGETPDPAEIAPPSELEDMDILEVLCA